MLFSPSPIRRWNSFRGPTPPATFDCFDYPYLIPRPSSTILDSRFGASDSSRLLTPYSPPLPPFRGNLSSGVQVAPKSGMGRFYSWLKTASREILKKEWRRNLMLFRKMYKIYKIVWINSHFERVFILVHMWIHLRQTKDGIYYIASKTLVLINATTP